MTVIILLSHGRIQYHSSVYSAWKKSKYNFEDKVGKISSENKGDECFFKRKWRSKSTKALVACINDPDTFAAYVFTEKLISYESTSFLRPSSKSHRKRGPPALRSFFI
jgi:hypothetical protein